MNDWTRFEKEAKGTSEMAYCCLYERGPYWFLTGDLTLPYPSLREGRRSW